MEANLPPGWFGRGRRRIEKLHDALEGFGDGDFVAVEPGGEFAFQFGKLLGQAGLRCCESLQPLARTNASIHTQSERLNSAGVSEGATLPEKT